MSSAKLTYSFFLNFREDVKTPDFSSDAAIETYVRNNLEPLSAESLTTFIKDKVNETDPTKVAVLSKLLQGSPSRQSIEVESTQEKALITAITFLVIEEVSKIQEEQNKPFAIVLVFYVLVHAIRRALSSFIKNEESMANHASKSNNTPITFRNVEDAYFSGENQVSLEGFKKRCEEQHKNIPNASDLADRNVRRRLSQAGHRVAVLLAGAKNSSKIGDHSPLMAVITDPTH